MSTEPTQPAPPQPEPPTDTERAHAFEWLRKLGLEGTTQEARLAYVAMQTMLRSAPPQPERNSLRDQLADAQAEVGRLRKQAESLIMAMETVRLDRKRQDTDGNVWALQTLEWAEWLMEKATEARAALKEG